MALRGLMPQLVQYGSANGFVFCHLASEPSKCRVAGGGSPFCSTRSVKLRLQIHEGQAPFRHPGSMP